MAVTLIVFVVRIDARLTTVREQQKDDGRRMEVMSENVAKTCEEVAKIQGQLAPFKNLQARNEP